MNERQQSGTRTARLEVLAGLLLLGGACAQVVIGCEDSTTTQAQGTTGAGGAGGESSSAGGSSSTQGSGGAGGAPCMPSHECGIEVLTEEKDKSYGDISLGPSRVFWVRDSGLSYRDKDPSAPEREDRFGGLGVQHVAAESDSSVYFATAKDVSHYDLPNDMLSAVMMNTNPTGLTVHMGYAYWPSAASNMIHKGKPGDVLAENDQTGSAPSLIASSEGPDQVYWTYRGPAPDMKTGGVKRLKAGDVAVSQDEPTGVAADGENVYWITVEGAIHKYAGASQMITNAEPLLADVHGVEGRVAVAADHVYWLGPDSTTCAGPCVCSDSCGAVWRVSKSDIMQSPEKFASMSSPVLKGLAVDKTHVYWTTGGTDSKLLRKAH